MNLEKKSWEKNKQQSCNDKIKYLINKHKLELYALFFAIAYRWAWVDDINRIKTGWPWPIHKQYLATEQEYKRTAQYLYDTKAGTYRNLTLEDLQPSNTR